MTYLRRFEFRAMGCQMCAMLESEDPRAEAALAEIEQLFEKWEQCLSRFRETSELANVNRAGRPVRVSETFWQVLRLSLQAAIESDGLVTPTVLEALEAAGYSRSLAGSAIPLPPAAGIAEAPRVPDWRVIKLNPSERIVALPQGIRLDLAGVAKGWAADQAARRLSRWGPAVVDASGDMAVSGPRSDGSSWPIGIEDPFGRDDDLPLMMLSGGGTATSTRTYRRWQRGDKIQHHLIDPRTGESAETDVLSATVIAPSTARAEVGAKVALILGSAEGIEWIDEREDLAALLVLENGQIKPSGRFLDHCWG